MKVKVKEKICKQCEKEFTPFKTTQKVCSVECAIKEAKEIEEKKEKREWNVRKREGRQKLKTLGQYEIEAKKEFQKWIRARDKNLPCISCGTLESKQWDGGHYFKSELYSGLIFHEDNCNKQCVYCNNHLHGNESNYRIGLVKKIGEERVKWLEENKDRLRTYKYSKKQLIEIKEEYKFRIKNNEF